MMSPVCLGGTYTLAGLVYHVEALTASTVCVRDAAGNRSQIHRVTFATHFEAVR